MTFQPKRPSVPPSQPVTKPPGQASGRPVSPRTARPSSLRPPTNPSVRPLTPSARPANIRDAITEAHALGGGAVARPSAVAQPIGRKGRDARRSGSGGSRSPSRASDRVLRHRRSVRRHGGDGHGGEDPDAGARRLRHGDAASRWVLLREVPSQQPDAQARPDHVRPRRRRGRNTSRRLSSSASVSICRRRRRSADSSRRSRKIAL